MSCKFFEEKKMIEMFKVKSEHVFLFSLEIMNECKIEFSEEADTSILFIYSIC